MNISAAKCLWVKCHRTKQEIWANAHGTRESL